MKTRWNRAFSLIVALVMVLSMIPATPVQVEATGTGVVLTKAGTSTTYASLTEALAQCTTASTTPVTIDVWEDTTLTNALTTNDTMATRQPITIDLHNNTVTITSNSANSAKAMWTAGGKEKIVTIKNGTFLDKTSGHTQAIFNSALSSGWGAFEMENVTFTNIDSSGVAHETGTGPLLSVRYYATSDVGKNDAAVNCYIKLSNCTINYRNLQHTKIFNGHNSSAIEYGEFIIDNTTVTITDGSNTQIFYGTDLDASNMTVTGTNIKDIICYANGEIMDSQISAVGCSRAYYIRTITTNTIPLHIGGTSTLSYTTEPTSTLYADSGAIAVEPSVTLTGAKLTDTITSRVYAKCENAFAFYSTLEEAVAAAAANETVTLLADCTLTGAATAANTGVILDLDDNELDLAGKTLTVSEFGTGDGTLVDSTGGDGLLKVAEDSASFTGTAPVAANTLPLYDTAESGYRVFGYTPVVYKAIEDTNAATETAVFWLDIAFAKDAAYAHVSGLDVGINISWTGGSLTEPRYFDDATISGWANKEATDTEKNYALYVKVTGVEAYDSVTVTPFVESAGVKATLNSATYSAA